MTKGTLFHNLRSGLKPAIWFLLCYFWLFLFFAFALITEDLGDEKSFRSYWIALRWVFAVAGLFWIAGASGFWLKPHGLLKALIIVSAFFLTTGVILYATMAAQFSGQISYFGGDPEGSIGMLYLPLLALSGIVTALLGTACFIRYKFRS